MNAKRKLCCRTLKTYQVCDKQNLDNIFKSYLGYCNFKGLHNLPNFLKGYKKKIVMIPQLGPPTFFVTCTFVERLWDHLIKILHIT